MSKVSYYKSKEDTKGGHDVDINSLIKGIKDGKWRDTVEKYRSTGDSSLKLSLPCFTGSGSFYERKASALKKHSGFLIIDIDKVSDPIRTKKILSQDRFTKWCFLSASGNGVAVVVKIDSGSHLDSFKKLTEYYRSEYSIDIDPSCKNIDRLRFVSFDPDICDGKGQQFVLNYVNTQRIFDIISDKIATAPDGEKHHTLVKAAYLAGGYVGGGVIDQSQAVDVLRGAISNADAKDLKRAYKTIDECITEGMLKPIYADEIIQFNDNETQRHEMVRRCWSLAMTANENGEEQNETLVDFIAREAIINIDQARKIITKVYQKHVDGHNVNNKSKVEKIEYFIKKRFTLRQNTVTETVEALVDGKWKPVNVDEIFRQCQTAKLAGVSMDKIKSLLRSDFVPCHDPFEVYFESLPDFDGESHIDKLSDCMVTDNQEFWKVQFRKALVRSIACCLDKGENRLIMVLIGEKQNTGKSTFIRFLSPFKDNYYTESPLQDNKDSRFQLAENFIYNLEELDSYSRLDVARLKSIISTSVIKERRPYAYQAVSVPRRCNFWGSTNKRGFLTDESNTRWLCFNVESIDWSYKETVDIHKLWSEAYKLFKSGFDYQLTSEEQDERDSVNKDHEVDSLERDLIVKHLTESTVEFMTNADIITFLQEKGQSIKLSSFNIGKTMAQLGFESKTKWYQKRTQRGWLCRERIFGEDENGSNEAEESSLPF